MANGNSIPDRQSFTLTEDLMVEPPEMVHANSRLSRLDKIALDVRKNATDEASARAICQFYDLTDNQVEVVLETSRQIELAGISGLEGSARIADILYGAGSPPIEDQFA